MRRGEGSGGIVEFTAIPCAINTISRTSNKYQIGVSLYVLHRSRWLQVDSIAIYARLRARHEAWWIHETMKLFVWASGATVLTRVGGNRMSGKVQMSSIIWRRRSILASPATLPVQPHRVEAVTWRLVKPRSAIIQNCSISCAWKEH